MDSSILNIANTIKYLAKKINHAQKGTIKIVPFCAMTEKKDNMNDIKVIYLRKQL